MPTIFSEFGLAVGLIIIFLTGGGIVARVFWVRLFKENTGYISRFVDALIDFLRMESQNSVEIKDKIGHIENRLNNIDDDLGKIKSDHMRKILEELKLIRDENRRRATDKKENNTADQGMQ